MCIRDSTLLMKFDGKQVEMASETGAESYKPGTIITSLYQVKSEQSTMLTLSLIHIYRGYIALPVALFHYLIFIRIQGTAPPGTCSNEFSEQRCV